MSCAKLRLRRTAVLRSQREALYIGHGTMDALNRSRSRSPPRGGWRRSEYQSQMLKVFSLCGRPTDFFRQLTIRGLDEPGSGPNPGYVAPRIRADSGPEAGVNKSGVWAASRPIPAADCQMPKEICGLGPITARIRGITDPWFGPLPAPDCQLPTQICDLGSTPDPGVTGLSIAYRNL